MSSKKILERAIALKQEERFIIVEGLLQSLDEPKGLLLNNLYDLTCLFVHTLRCGNSYITLLCAYFHALVMNENPSQYCIVYFITSPNRKIDQIWVEEAEKRLRIYRDGK